MQKRKKYDWGAPVVPETAPEPVTEPVSGGKKIKHVLIEAMFPELKGANIYKNAHGEASGTKPAIARAFRALLSGMHGKRVSVIKATITITTRMEG